MPVVIEKSIPSASYLIDNDLPIYIGRNKFPLIDEVIKVVIVNLMPNKEETERQILKQLANSPFMVEVRFLQLKTHQSKNTASSYLNNYYETWEEIQREKADGMIITGAPLENIDFEAVNYWEELKEIMDYAKEKIGSTLFICWGAIAGLYHYYGIPKSLIDKKVFGVFSHNVNNESTLFEEFDNPFWVPHSRYFQLEKTVIDKTENLEVLSESRESGIYVVASKDRRQVFATGHLEYDKDTLKSEFERDIQKGIEIEIPKHYFPQNNPENHPEGNWEQYGQKFFTNWLHHYVKKS